MCASLQRRHTLFRICACVQVHGYACAYAPQFSRVRTAGHEYEYVCRTCVCFTTRTHVYTVHVFTRTLAVLLARQVCVYICLTCVPMGCTVSTEAYTDTESRTFRFSPWLYCCICDCRVVGMCTYAVYIRSMPRSLLRRCTVSKEA